MYIYFYFGNRFFCTNRSKILDFWFLGKILRLSSDAQSQIFTILFFWWFSWFLAQILPIFVIFGKESSKKPIKESWKQEIKNKALHVARYDIFRMESFLQNKNLDFLTCWCRAENSVPKNSNYHTFRVFSKQSTKIIRVVPNFDA